MVGGTIGLIAQTFNLSGGWQSFAVSWALLSTPFILVSRLLAELLHSSPPLPRNFSGHLPPY